MHPGVVWPARRPYADQLLVCLSYRGGGTAAFRPWARVLADDCDLALICYPGRERRFSEPALRDWPTLFGDALAAVRSVADRPYVLFGHSTGTWMAFEVAVAMERSSNPPVALVVSAGNAPTRAEEERRRTPRAGAPDEDLLRWMVRFGQLPPVVLADPDARQMALDLFRADSWAADSYEYVPGRTVRAPLHVLCGTDDAQVDGDGGWEPLATGGYRLDRLPGGHFYTTDVWATLPRWMPAVTTA